jgi:hypothetical protein
MEVTVLHIAQPVWYRDALHWQSADSWVVHRERHNSGGGSYCGLVETRDCDVTWAGLTLLVAGLADWVRCVCDRWQGTLPVWGRAGHGQVMCSSRAVHEQVTSRSRARHMKVTSRSIAGHMKVTSRSRESHEQVTSRSRAGHEHVTSKSRAGHVQVTRRSRAGFHQVTSKSRAVWRQSINVGQLFEIDS